MILHLIYLSALGLIHASLANLSGGQYGGGQVRNQHCRGAAGRKEGLKVTRGDDSILTDLTTYEPVRFSRRGNIEEELVPVERRDMKAVLAKLIPGMYVGKCTRSGFFAVPQSCHKYIRCVSNGDGSYQEFKFDCGPGTAWDISLNTCNHSNLVKRCRIPDITRRRILVPEADKVWPRSTLIKAEKSRREHKQRSPAPGRRRNPVVEQEPPHEFFRGKKGSPILVNRRNPVVEQEPPHEFFRGKKGSPILVNRRNPVVEQEPPHEFFRGKKGSPILVNRRNSVVEPSHGFFQDRQSYQTQRPRLHFDHPSEMFYENCGEAGFFGVPGNCRKFIRCVDNGVGSYIKFQFTCNPGTAWDTTLQACNHDYLVGRCKYESQQQPTKPSAAGSMSNQGYPGQEQTPHESDNSLVQNQSQPPSGGYYEKHTTLAPDMFYENCVEAGFFGVPGNCRKFVRCVDNGLGSYIKFQFTCEPGTAWDTTLEACNHIYLVGRCKYESQQPQTKPSATGKLKRVYQRHKQNHPSSGNSFGEPTTIAPELGMFSGVCTKSGFFGVPGNCRKFIRCVSDRVGGFTQFKYSCGPGTAWDMNLSICNYVHLVKRCENESKQPSETKEMEGNQGEEPKPPENTSETTPSAASDTTTPGDAEPDEPQEQTTNTPTTSPDETANKDGTTAGPGEAESTDGTTAGPGEAESTDGTTASPGEAESTDGTTAGPGEAESTDGTTAGPGEAESTGGTTAGPGEAESTDGTTTGPGEAESTGGTTAGPGEAESTDGTTAGPGEAESSDGTTAGPGGTESTTDTTPSPLVTESTTILPSPTDSPTNPSSESAEMTTISTVTEEPSWSSTNGQETCSSRSEPSTPATPAQENCPTLKANQNAYVCPTSFKRHQKMCHSFYQCTVSEDTWQINIMVLTCANNTVFDEEKIQCLPPSPGTACHSQEKILTRREKEITFIPTLYVSEEKSLCPSEGLFPFEKDCTKFYTCKKTANGKIEGFLSQCPKGQSFYGLSRKCKKGRKCETIARRNAMIV